MDTVLVAYEKKNIGLVAFALLCFGSLLFATTPRNNGGQDTAFIACIHRARKPESLC